ncbi:hypothetical protein [aff. Roholtiella sp. LEGE 12411]|uniref:hypothetical protein n=1 Tax=aff. Roholtiella sp. LEGE 12411 TaxID=1828822 RepID=UPI00187FCA9F|nr:hypothetical protein [aff. Roholtiella sp. LEGE 12411]MBE9037065.1 hypothetical protein [aff. Roholtiella sp. LEGE 12411]
MTTPISSNPETVETKRQNFNITPEQEAKLNWLRDAIADPNTKETILKLEAEEERYRLEEQGVSLEPKTTH